MSSRTRLRKYHIAALEAERHRHGFYDCILTQRGDTLTWEVKCGCGWKYTGLPLFSRKAASDAATIHNTERSEAPS
jgi:hypothetical protein